MLTNLSCFASLFYFARIVSVMNRLEPSPTASLQVNMDLSPSLVPCFRALVFALAIYILALAYAHVAGTF
jgi:hypothetical protein